MPRLQPLDSEPPWPGFCLGMELMDGGGVMMMMMMMMIMMMKCLFRGSLMV